MERLGAILRARLRRERAISPSLARAALSIDRLAEHLFPERATELAGVWRAKSLEYQWLSALSRQRADFCECTDAALRHAARVLKLELSGEHRDRLMGAWLELRAWPDVPPALRALKLQGQRLAPLANLSTSILDAGIEASALGGLFDEVLSTERIGTFKPDPRAYALALESLGVLRDDVVYRSEEARQIPASEGRLVGRTTGEVELEDKVLVIRRVHVRLELAAAKEHQEVAERVHGFFAMSCPLYRTLKASIAITTELAFVAPRSSGT